MSSFCVYACTYVCVISVDMGRLLIDLHSLLLSLSLSPSPSPPPSFPLTDIPVSSMEGPGISYQNDFMDTQSHSLSSTQGTVHPASHVTDVLPS